MKKPEVELPDVRSRSEILEVFGFDPNKVPGHYWFTFFDADLGRLRTLFEALHAEGFHLDGVEPASVTWQKLYGTECWSLQVGLNGIYPPQMLKAIAKDLCQRVTLGQAWAILPVIGTSSALTATGPVSWQKIWGRAAKKAEVQGAAVAKERSKADLSHIARHFKGRPRSKNQLSPWLPLTTLKVTGRGLVLVDMRPGPSEDELEIGLAAGCYRLEIQILEPAKRIATLRAVARPGKHLERGKTMGKISTDMSTVGVFDRGSLRAIRKQGDEAFRSWCEDARQGQPDEYGLLIHDFQKKAMLAYVQTGHGDGTFPVFELLSGRKRIGFEVEFIPATAG